MKSWLYQIIDGFSDERLDTKTCVRMNQPTGAGNSNRKMVGTP